MVTNPWRADLVAAAASTGVPEGRAVAADGTAVETLLTGPETYLYTAHTAAELLARTAAGSPLPATAPPPVSTAPILPSPHRAARHRRGTPVNDRAGGEPTRSGEPSDWEPAPWPAG